MLQFSTEVIISFAQTICYLGLILLSLMQSVRKNLPILRYFSLIFAIYLIQYLAQGISYMYVFDNYPLAYTWKIISVAFTILMTFASIILIDYIQAQRVRIWFLICITLIGSIEFCVLILTNGLIPYDFYENGQLIARSIGKVGLGLYLDIALAGINAFVLIGFFTKSYLKAPSNLKKETKKLMLTLWIMLTIAAGCNIIARFLPNSSFTMILYSAMAIALLLFSTVLLIVVIHKPQVLYILPFQVDRLVIINAKDKLSGKNW